MVLPFMPYSSLSTNNLEGKLKGYQDAVLYHFNHYLNNKTSFTIYVLRVEVSEGQNGCNTELGSRVGNKDALAAK